MRPLPAFQHGPTSETLAGFLELRSRFPQLLSSCGSQRRHCVLISVANFRDAIVDGCLCLLLCVRQLFLQRFHFSVRFVFKLL